MRWIDVVGTALFAHILWSGAALVNLEIVAAAILAVGFAAGAANQYGSNQ